jgi:hypothetical protein
MPRSPLRFEWTGLACACAFSGWCASVAFASPPPTAADQATAASKDAGVANPKSSRAKHAKPAKTAAAEAPKAEAIKSPDVEPKHSKTKSDKVAKNAANGSAAAAPAKPTTTTASNKQSKAAVEPAPSPGTPLAATAKPAPLAAPPAPICSLEDPEQPRGGRLEVLSHVAGQTPVVRIAGKALRMIERREDRISVQVPADSDGGEVTLLHDGRDAACGKLIIIGKNR